MVPKVHAGMEVENVAVKAEEKGGRKKKMRDFLEKAKAFPGFAWRATWRVGKEDPRRAIHALKVGLSLTLVSLLYLMEPLFEGVGQNAIWAVMTVVVVLEFTAGATLCKGLNRGLGTLLAGSLAFFIEYIANESDRVFRAVFIGAAVFLIGAAATYMRFFPKIKKNYDYGVLIFLLTFNLITVSSYRVENVLKIAHERFYTIAIGCGICLLMSLLIFPNWSGEDLHNSTVLKLEGLAISIEACVAEYFNDAETGENNQKSNEDEDPIYKGFKAVLDSKSQDETMALHASWEPRHSRHCYKYPWQQYVRLGGVLRSFGYTVVALHGCLQTEIQTPRSVRAVFKDPCMRLSGEVSKVLMELSDSIRRRRHCSPELLSDHLHQALHDLNAAIKSQPRLFLGSAAPSPSLARAACPTPDTPSSPATPATPRRPKPPHSNYALSSVKTDSSALMEWKKSSNNSNKMLRPQLSRIAITSLEFSEALPLAAFASLLVETVAKLDHVIGEVEELGRMACFKEFDRNSTSVSVDVKSCSSESAYNTPKKVNVVVQSQLASHGTD